MSDYYVDSNVPSTGSALSSAVLRAEFDLISAAFAKIAPYTGNGGKIVAINAGGTAQEAVATTGTGDVVRATNPVLVAPDLGTPSAGVLTNCTGTAAGLTAGTATLATNATQAANAAKFDSTTTVLASATTVNLGASTTFNNAISGSTPVEGFDTVAEGVLRKVTCTGAVPFVYSANLLLIGGVDRTCSIGDVMLWRSKGSGVWTEEIYQPIAGYPVSHGVRQIVLTGPYDSSGDSNFLPASATGLTLTSENIDSSNPLIVSSFNGFNASGPVDVIGKTESNLEWTMENNAENFPYVTIASSVLTPGNTILPPVIQPSGVPDTTDGQITVNTVDAKVYLGNGATAPQTNLVVVGRVTTSGGNITETSASYYSGRINPIRTVITSTNAAWIPNVATKKMKVSVLSGGSSGSGSNTGAQDGLGGLAGIISTAISTSISGAYAATVGAGGTAAAGVTSDAGTDSSFIGTGLSVTATGAPAPGTTAAGSGGNLAKMAAWGEASQIALGAAPVSGSGPCNSAAANTGAGGGSVYASSGSVTRGAGGSGRIEVEEYI